MTNENKKQLKKIKSFFIIGLSTLCIHAQANDIEDCDKVINYFENADKIYSEQDKYTKEELLPFSKSCKIATEKFPENIQYKLALADTLSAQLKFGEAAQLLEQESAKEKKNEKYQAALIKAKLFRALYETKSEEDVIEGIKELKGMAKSGNTEVLLTVAVIYSFFLDNNILRSDKDILPLIEGEAKKGNRKVQQVLGLILNSDTEEGFHWTFKSAMQGNASAITTIKSFLQFHISSVEKTDKLTKEIIALAEKGNPYAQDILADVYNSPANIKKSIPWRLKAAENGNIHSQISLGVAYINGEKGVLDKDIKKAKYWLNKAVKQGSKRAEMVLSTIIE